MASLLPTILSDDEEENDEIEKKKNADENSGQGKEEDKNKKIKKKKKKKDNEGKKRNESEANDENDGDDEEDYEVDRSFEFGGALGEDGNYLSFSSIPSATTGGAGWSYQTAIDSIRRGMGQTTTTNDGDNDDNDVVVPPPRMDVASIIAAKRSNLLDEKKKNNNNKKKAASSEKEEEKEEDSDAESEGSDDDESGSDDDDDDSSSDDDGDKDGDEEKENSSSDDEDDDEEEVDDEHDAGRDLEGDVLKTRIGADEQKENDDDDDKENRRRRGSRKQEESPDDDSDSDDDDVSDEEEAAKAAAFFDDGRSSGRQRRRQQDDDDEDEKVVVFPQLNLCRPVLRGVAAMGYVQPTPIQSRVIPLALSGRDICASAVTGSGKTAAFVLPLLERIVLRHAATSRCTKALVLTPTRELAAQCLGMTSTLSQYTQIRSCLIVGGSKNVAAQGAELRSKPDIVIATPGRLLDHLINTPGVLLDAVEFLVLDEADRLLDLGFQDEVHEIVKSCPVQRQTMLFSATMNTSVDELIKLSLKRPVRIRISGDGGNGRNQAPSSKKDIEVAPRLEQEFVRVRPGNEGLNRDAMMLSLLSRTYRERAIVFFDTKVRAHRFMILCGLVGIRCAELHGNLTQQQRLTALEEFRRGDVDVLLATDLAARGLDIDRVDAVVNYEMPNQIEAYIHRIGRTARAGRSGRSCTLIGEGRRHLMKEVMKDAANKQQKKKKTQGDKNGNGRDEPKFESGVIRSRVIPPAVVAHYASKIASLESHVEDVMEAEKVAKMDRIAEMEAVRAQNILEHSDDILSRPQREWFASTEQKRMTKAALAEKQRLIEEKAGTGTHRMTRKKRRKREAMEALKASEDVEDDQDGGGKQSKAAKVNVKAAARASKRKDEAKKLESSRRTIAEETPAAAEKKKKKTRKQTGEEEMMNDDDGFTNNNSKKKRRKTAMDASGDSSLFQEEKVTYSSRKTTTKKSDDQQGDGVAKSSYHFRGYDPNKKLGKKKSHKAFKSKSKYKRR